MDSGISDPQLDSLSRCFQQFAVECRHHASPLYERLAVSVGSDPEMLALAARARSGPVPNLFFAAAHFLLLKGTEHPVSRFYPSLFEQPDPVEGAYPAFRSFCLEHRGGILKLISERRVQTNEVRRCACLLPAFGLASSQARGRPLALVEVGASAGLNLLWDHYGYDYGGGGRCGDQRSSVQIHCALRGDGHAPIPVRRSRRASDWSWLRWICGILTPCSGFGR